MNTQNYPGGHSPHMAAKRGAAPIPKTMVAPGFEFITRCGETLYLLKFESGQRFRLDKLVAQGRVTLKAA